MPRFDDRPEAFDGVGVDRAMHVLPVAVIDDSVRVLLSNARVTAVLVGRDKAYPSRDSHLHEGFKRFVFGVLDHAGDHVPLRFTAPTTMALPCGPR